MRRLSHALAVTLALVPLALVPLALTTPSSAQAPAPAAPGPAPQGAPAPQAPTGPTPQAPTGNVPQAPAPAPTTPAPAPGGQDRQRSAPAFRTAIDVVSLNVTATDNGSKFVTDLELADFSVFEDGIKQDVTFFNREPVPIALSLLLDSSASMEASLATLQTAATNFVRRLKANDLAQIIDFDSRVVVRQAFTANQEELVSAIHNTAAGGSTSLHNAIYIALKELAKIRAVSEADIRRQALVVFSDGEDTSSLVSFDEVLDLAKRSETALYTIALRGPDTETKGFREAEFVMRQLAQETGGRAFFPAKIEDLAGAYQQIADELSSQYALGYMSRNARRDGAYRRIVVQVARPNVAARTKRGYYAPTSR